MVVRVKIVSVDVDDVGLQDHLNANLQVEPGLPPPESKTERLSCHQEAIIICFLITFYCFIAFK